MSLLSRRILHLINNDRLTVAVTCTAALIPFCYIYWSFWIAPWPGTLILLSLCLGSLYTVDRKINTYLAKLCRAMTGILALWFLGLVCDIHCYSRRWRSRSKKPSPYTVWQLEYQSLAVLTLSLGVTCKVRKVFLNRISWGGLAVAGILDSVLILFLMTRANRGPLGPGFSWENQ
jgi:hypothetical protein